MDDAIVVTGGAGFIGSALTRHLIRETGSRVICLDKLTYAGNLESLKPIADSPRFAFERADIADRDAMERILRKYRPRAISHLAAESHVDRSIDGPDEFMTTNVMGTFRLLQAARGYLAELPESERETFKFHHISTDEVYGALGDTGVFTEHSRYMPNSPYAASKAASDHLVRAWGETFDLPVVVTNCSNNYGPYQFPEKLIPHMILRALSGRTLPVYGDGSNVRDWLHVVDHVSALHLVLESGQIGDTYVIGGRSERTNLQVVESICDLLDRKRPRSSGDTYRDLITFVTDRPGHDHRYAINPSKIEQELGWAPTYDFESGLENTVDWYLDHEGWWRHVLSGAYRVERAGVL